MTFAPAKSAAQSVDLTVDVLVNSSNTTGYNTSSSSPGEYQRYPERYLEHLQIPYRVIDVSSAAPPDLSTVQLVIAGHKGLNLSTAWQTAITNAVAAGVGFVDLDNDPNIGSQSHMQAIFGATGSTTGAAASEIIVPAAVQPGGASPHYIAGMQLHFLSDPAGDLIYKFHGDGISSYPTVTPTVLTGAHGTTVATLYSTDHSVASPLILATTYGKGSAVYFGSYDYLRADRFGFSLGVDDLFWRSLVWAARKPFVIRAYPRLFALQMDDNAETDNLFATRIQHFWDTSLTGQVLSDGTGGPWKIDVYHDATTIGDFGSANRDLFVSEIQAGHVKASPHRNTDIIGGDLYWNSENGPLTDSQWLSELNQTLQLNKGNGGNDSIPISRSMIPEFWDMSNNLGYDMWNTLGYRYVLEIQEPGAAYYSSTYKTNAQRLPFRPFRIYEQPPLFNNQDETEPFFWADYYPIGSRAGLGAKTFFGFGSQILTDNFRFPSPDAKFPDYQGANSFPVANSVENFEVNAWRFWSALAPVTIFCHDENSYANTPDTERKQFIQQLSSWLNTHGVVHTFVENEGDYLLARRTSTLVSGQATPSQITLNFSGQATDFDGNLIPTKALVFYGNDEGSWVSVPGFPAGGKTVSFANATPPSINLSAAALNFAATPGTNPPSQSVALTNAGGGTLSWNATSNASWLNVSPGSGTGSSTLTVSISTSGLSSGTYNGSIAVSAIGATNSPQYVNVTLVVGATAISVSPSSLAFTAYQNQGDPAAQTVALTNSGGGTLQWTATSTVPWLTVTPSSGSGAATLTVTAKTAGLGSGAFSGAVKVSSTNASNSPLSIPVSLAINGVLMGDTFASGTLAGWAYSPLGLASDWSVVNSAVHFNGAGHTQIYAGDAAWTDYTVQASIKLASLANYPGGIRGRINPSTGASYAVWLYPNSSVIRLYKTQQWNIDAGFTTLGEASLTFDATAFHTVALAMQGSNLQVLYDGKAVLTATDTAYTSGMIALDVSSQPIDFTNVLVTGASSASAALAPSPASLNFTYSTGSSAPAAQNVALATSGNAPTVAWSSTTTAPWVHVSPATGVTPATLAVSVDPTGLAPGSYTGSVALSSLATTNSPQNVAVTLAVNSPAAVLSVSPGTMNFAAGVSGSATSAQNLAISSSGGAANSWTVASDSAWLHVSSSSGATPATVAVTADPGGLAAGTYNGNLTVTAPGLTGSPATVAVTFTVSPLFAADDFSSGTLDGWTASPMGLFSGWSVVKGAAQYNGGGGTQLYAGNFAWGDYSFTTNVQLISTNNYPGGIRGRVQPNGGGYAAWLYPGSGQIVLYRVAQWNIDQGYASLGSASVAFDTQVHALKLSMTGSQISVSMDGKTLITATDGTYSTGAIAFDVSSQPIRYGNVVVAGPAATPGSLAPGGDLTFSGTAGGANPAPQSLAVGASGSTALAYSAVSSASWLAVTPAGGTSGGTLSVSVDTTGLATGTYKGTIRLAALGDNASPETVNVTLQVQ